MKKALSILTALFALVLVALPVSAQAEKCSLGAVSVVNDVTPDAKAHSKIIWGFSCNNGTKDFGQLTKFLYHIPVIDEENFEATDSLGTMKVLEGPQYASATVSGKESTVGVILRKPLLITDSATSASITVEFDSFDLLSKGENGSFSISPGSQISSPKATIITSGVTETTYDIAAVNYELNLPTDANADVPLGCAKSGSRIICQNLNKTAFDSLQIKWIKPEAKTFLDKITKNFRNIFKGLSDKVSQLLKKYK